MKLARLPENDGKLKILVMLEHDESGISPASFQLLTAAKSIKEECRLFAVLIGKGADRHSKTLVKYLVDCVYIYDDGDYLMLDSHRAALAVVDCARELLPEILLIPATDTGRQVAAAAAVALKTGLVADCTGFSLNAASRLVQTRPAYGDSLIAEVLTEKTLPQIATVRENMFPPYAALSDHPPLRIARRLRSAVMPEAKFLGVGDAAKASLSSAKIILAVGAGIKQKKDIGLFEEAAVKLGGMLGCSRALVERGFMPQSRQIGLSGMSVAPKLLIAMGISGSVQFLAGAKGAEKIISINTSGQARISSAAHVPIIADMYEVAKQIISG